MPERKSKKPKRGDKSDKPAPTEKADAERTPAASADAEMAPPIPGPKVPEFPGNLRKRGQWFQKRSGSD